MASPYDAILDAGDHLVAALHAGDLDTAVHALGERGRILSALEARALPRPPAEAVERFRAQDQQLHEALQGLLLSLAAAAAAADRAATAAQQYGARPPRPSLLDTVPR